MKNRRAQRRSEKIRGYSQACLDWWAHGESGRYWPLGLTDIYIGTVAYSTYNDAWRWLLREFPDQEFYARRLTGYMLWPQHQRAEELVKRMLDELEAS